MYMNQNQAVLGTAPVLALMKKYSIPCILSLMVAALYNIVDQIFIANASYLGSAGNAANTVVFPLTVVALSIAVMTGDGACAFVSISMGKKEDHQAAQAVGNAIEAMVVSSIVITVLYLLFAGQILTFFGAAVNEATFAASQSYFFWITMGIPAYMIGQGLNPILRSDGAPRFAMGVTLCGAAVNIVLDPVFIFGFKWGMMGAALATILGQIVTCLISVWYMARRTMLIRLDRESFRFSFAIFKNCVVLGMTSFLSQISIVASMAAIQNMTVKYGGLSPIYSQAAYAQIPMAVIGIVMKFFQIIISVAVGLAAGCIPVAGYNIGAGLKERVCQLFTSLLLAEAMVGAVAWLIAELFPIGLISLFGASSESVYYTQFAVKCFRIFLSMTVLATVNKGCFIYLQALGKGKESAALSLCREIVFGVGFALVLPLWFGLDGVLYSMPASDLCTFFMTVFIIRQTYKELGQSQTSLLAQSFARLKKQAG